MELLSGNSQDWTADDAHGGSNEEVPPSKAKRSKKVSKDPTEDELLDDFAAISPLTALDPEEVDRLQPRQRDFLLAFINSGSVTQARKQANIKPGTWRKYQQDERFMQMFNTIKNPVTFSYALGQAIIYRAALEHFKLLQDDRVSIKQWAIDNAYNKVAQAPQKDSEQRALTYREAKQIVQSTVDDSSQLAKSPFEIVDAEFQPVEEEESD